MILFAIVPGGGIAQPSAGGAPAAAGSTATVYRADEDGAVTSLGAQTLYNVSTAEAVPASVPCTVVQTPGGHYVARRWLGQASPNAVDPAAVFQSPNF